MSNGRLNKVSIENDDDGAGRRQKFGVDNDLIGNYEIEKHTFRTSRYIYDDKCDNDEDDGTIEVEMKSATSTCGRNLIVPDHDATGIMIWPASHLLCQYLSYVLTQPTGDEHINNTDTKVNVSKPIQLGNTILELGCGCGISGIVAAAAIADRIRHATEKLLTREQHASTTAINPETTVVLTDMDSVVIELCRQNIHRSQHKIHPTTTLIAAKLGWGDVTAITHIMDHYTTGDKKFDTVIGADIVYPDTSELALSCMFQTVDSALRQGGCFLLSFASRDGHRTPSKFIQAANDARFRIGLIPSSTFMPISCEGEVFLPPTLDARLLCLTRDSNALEYNDHLGGELCEVFPGLKKAIAHADEESSEEDWQPPCFSDDNDS